MTHPQIARALRLMNMEKNGTPTVAEFEALLADQGRLDAFIELLQRPGAAGQLAGYPNLMQALIGTEAGLTSALSSASTMAEVAKSQAAMLAFINSQSALDAIFARPAVAAAFLASTALAKASVPKMTSNTTPSGVASASATHSALFAAWTAMDGNANTYWGPPAGVSVNEWLQYEFAGEAFIAYAEVSTYEGANSPKSCSIECSSDGAIFTSAKSVTLAAGVKNKIQFTNTGFYKYWRFFIENTYGGQALVYELNFTGFVSP